jgi:hypothetical protein
VSSECSEGHDSGSPAISLPHGGVDLGKGFALFCAQDRYDQAMRPCEALTLTIFIHKLDSTVLGSHCLKIA